MQGRALTFHSPTDSASGRSDPHRALQVYCALGIVALGALQSWTHRYLIYSDGISYLEIADAYASGKWREAINAYWSPLYSWLIAVTHLLFRPSPAQELPLLHALGFAIFLFALFAFELFIRELRRISPAAAGRCFIAVSHLVFAWASLALIWTFRPLPDMTVLAILFLCAALALRVEQTHSPAAALALGFVLAFGYFAKTAMFPVSVVFLLCLAPKRKCCLIASLAFIVTCSPFMIAVSASKERLTIGDSGRLNYAWEVNHIRRSVHWQGSPGTPAHATRSIHEAPEVFEFVSPVPGFYPPWRDPSYWYEGVPVEFNLRNQVAAIPYNGSACLLRLITCPGLLIAVCDLLTRRARIGHEWRCIIVPSAFALAMYCLVFVEPRYIAGFGALISISVLASASTGSSQGWKLAIAVCGLLSFVLLSGADLLNDAQVVQSDIKGQLSYGDGELAKQLKSEGVLEGVTVGYIGASMDAYPVRLCGARIVCEVPVHYWRYHRGIKLGREELERFWEQPPEQRKDILTLMHTNGASAVIADMVPAWADTTGWKELGNRGFPALTPHLPSDSRAYIYHFAEDSADRRGPQ
jgi:hypothetical protein